MSKAAMNLQDSFLNQVRRENSEVRVLLVNGTLLRGTVKGFDNFTLILNNRNGQHLIYKHAVAQIVTHRAQMRTEDFHHADADSEADKDGGDAQKPDAAGEQPSHSRSSEKANGKSSNSRSGDNSHSRQQHNAPQESGSRNKQQPKKEGFNKLDLSQVKLGEGEKR